MKNRIALFCLISSFAFLSFVAKSENHNTPIYLNTAYSFKERSVDLVSRMTLEEKQSQLGNTMPPIPRLGVKKYDVWGEALHGVMGRNDNSGMTATSFPNSIAVGCSWDPELIKRETDVIADEARGFNFNYIFTLTYWSPVIEPTRDPRWGRTAETFGEDPFLVSQIGSAFIRGLMGDDPTYLKTVPCGKHFFANNTEFNRHSGSADMDDRDTREFYLYPYKYLIQKDNLPSIMTAYSAVNGIPVSASTFYVDSIARRTYGMDGYVTGDCGAISDLISGHHFAKNGEEATSMGLISGVDCDCGSVYQANAIDALNRGLITEADIDRALINIFTIRMRLGEFDPQNKVPYAGIRPSIINDPSHNALALEIATKTPVLLKNEILPNTNRKALPLNAATLKKIAILGSQADKIELGDYSGEVEAAYKVTPLDGLKTYIAENNLAIELVTRSGGNTSKRTDFFTMIGFSTVTKSGNEQTFDATKFDASSGGLITSARFGGVSVMGIKDGDWTAYHNVDITDVDSIRFNMTVSGLGGTIEVRVGSVNGNILASQTIANTQQGRGGFGRSRQVPVKINTLGITGNQTLVFVYHEAEVPSIDQEIIDLAAASDAAILFVGTDQSTGREESDRFSLKLPGNQNELIEAVAAVNAHTILVIQGMGMVEVEAFKNNPNIKGILFTGYNGQAQGTAMAKILFGEVNPGGKTSVTWYKSLSDLPDFNDYTLRSGPGKNGRTYMYFNKDVSYEFGYGLSYTTFAYSNFAISKKSITPNDLITLTVDVKNTGDVDGDEVVQVYVKTPDSPASLERPIKRLKGFKRVTIPRGQTRTVSIDVDCSDLWFWDIENKRITFDQGTYVFEIGASSIDIKGQVAATMDGAYKTVLSTVVAAGDQSVLRPGETLQTNVSASMSDDRFYDIKKATVRYKSNNVQVADVDSEGNVTANSPGVATIFAYVTVDGVTKSSSYPVKVMPDLTPGSIQVGGKEMKDFDKDVKAYSFLLKKNAALPVITATALSADIVVDVAQANGIPGTTIVTFVDEMTCEKNTYYFNFDVQSVSDEFLENSVGKQWQWIRENKATYNLSENPGMLTITSEVGDVSEASNNAKNILLQSANNDWVIETELFFSRTPSQPENAGILALQDENNFVKLMLRAVTKTTNQRRNQNGELQIQPGTIDLIVEENGIAMSAASFNVPKEITGTYPLVLKLEKKGSRYTAYYALDGGLFNELGVADVLLKDIKAGLIACDGVIITSMKNVYYFNPDVTKLDTPFDVSFNYFRITNSGRK